MKEEETQDTCMLDGEQLYKLLIAAGEKAIGETFAWLDLASQAAEIVSGEMTATEKARQQMRELVHKSIAQRSIENYANAFASSIGEFVGQKLGTTDESEAGKALPNRAEESWKALHKLLEGVWREGQTDELAQQRAKHT